MPSRWSQTTKIVSHLLQVTSKQVATILSLNTVGSQIIFVSLWGVHIGVAVIITTLVVGYFRVSRFNRWGLIFLSGTFATVPDWWWVFTERFVPSLQIPWVAQPYRVVLHNSMLADLFWFHHVIDTVGTDDVSSSVIFAAGSLVVFLLVEYYLSAGQNHVERVIEYAD